MNNRSLTFEHILYIIVFLLALGIRVIALGELPLSDFEAAHAVPAFQVSRGEHAELGSQPSYVLLTGLAFFIFGSSEATARLWPVLAGSALVLLPFLLRNRLGRKTALTIAFGLALDPGLISLSQLAGGPMLAVSFLLFALASWWNGWAIAAGILAGFALLSGPATLAGALGLAITAGIARMLRLFPAEEGRLPGKVSTSPAEAGITPARAGLLAAGGTLLLAGTLFLRYPQGLSAFASSLPEYLRGWAVFSGVPVFRLLIAFFAYPLLAVLFGSVALVRSWIASDETAQIGRALSIWLGVALLLGLFYPGRQVADVAWALIPLWGLAGLEFSRYLVVEKGDYVPWALAGLVVVMLANVWTNLASLAASNAEGQTFWLRWLVIGGAVLLVALSSILINMGWTKDAASRGLAWGTAIALGFGMFAGVWGATQREITTRLELWKPIPGAGQQALLLQTIGDLGDWTLGREDSIQIVSLVEAPSLRWVLRGFPNVRFENGLNREELPEVIITWQDHEELSLGSSYRGQDFAWWSYPNWDGWTSMEWLKWLSFRQGTGTTQSVILWGRGDLFYSGDLLSDGGASTGEGAAP